MTDKLTIRLGSKEFETGLLTLRQLQDIENVLVNLTTAKEMPRPFATSVLVLRITFPSVDLETQAASREEVIKASGEILKFGGFVPAEQPGEAPAAGIESPSGEISTAA